MIRFTYNNKTVCLTKYAPDWTAEKLHGAVREAIKEDFSDMYNEYELDCIEEMSREDFLCCIED